MVFPSDPEIGLLPELRFDLAGGNTRIVHPPTAAS
jgi:hypothetical protein